MSPVPAPYDAAVVIGRFQPFHHGHRALIEHALTLAPRVFVVLGSAHSPRSPKNPWTHTEREHVIAATLPASPLQFLPVRDYYDEPRWRAEVVRRVNALLTEFESPRVAVVGHFKDSSSSYLEGFSEWQIVSRDLVGTIHATALRDAYFEAAGASVSEYVASLAAVVPEPTRQALQRFAATDDYKHLVEEWRALRDYRESWRQAPFTPIFVTVDALVTCNAHVILVQRGKAPGRGLWALPGGFIDAEETTLQSARRELAEETQLVLDCTARQPVASKVFDHPARSQRGRTLSHVFRFVIDAPSLPPLVAADDAALARWVPIPELLSLETQMFDDHFHILDSFLKLLP